MKNIEVYKQFQADCTKDASRTIEDGSGARTRWWLEGYRFVEIWKIEAEESYNDKPYYFVIEIDIDYDIINAATYSTSGRTLDTVPYEHYMNIIADEIDKKEIDKAICLAQLLL